MLKRKTATAAVKPCAMEMACKVMDNVEGCRQVEVEVEVKVEAQKDGVKKAARLMGCPVDADWRRCRNSSPGEKMEACGACQRRLNPHLVMRPPLKSSTNDRLSR